MKKLEAKRERERKAEERKKAAEDKKREKEMARALAQQVGPGICRWCTCTVRVYNGAACGVR